MRLLHSRLIACFLLAAASPSAWAATVMVQLRHARSEDVERIVARLLPAVGIAAIPAQSAVLLTGEPEQLSEAAAIIRSVDVPNRMVELEIGIDRAAANSERLTAAGIGLRRPRSPPGWPPATPAQLRNTSGTSNEHSRQTVVVTPGTTAELTVGQEEVRDLGPFDPPVEIVTGKRVRIDDVRVLGEGSGVELTVAVQDTMPGPVPLSSSGVWARTRLRLRPGETGTVATHDERGVSPADETGVSGDERGGQVSVRRVRARRAASAVIAVKLRAVR